MNKNNGEIYSQFFKGYPEVFNGDVISINLLAMLMKQLEQEDKIIFDRCVLIEKTGNLYGRKLKLVKLFNQLTGG